METAQIFQIQSFIIFGLLTLGLVKRKQKIIHRKFMLSAMIWDILLILQIELNRGAIAKASKVLSNKLILNIHVGMAITCVIGYFFMMYSGKFLFLGANRFRSLHQKIGIFTYSLRLLTLITSFFVVIPKA